MPEKRGVSHVPLTFSVCLGVKSAHAQYILFKTLSTLPSATVYYHSVYFHSLLVV